VVGKGNCVNRLEHPTGRWKIDMCDLLGLVPERSREFVVTARKLFDHTAYQIGHRLCQLAHSEKCTGTSFVVKSAIDMLEESDVFSHFRRSVPTLDNISRHNAEAEYNTVTRTCSAIRAF